jgi:hypothetical protein
MKMKKDTASTDNRSLKKKQFDGTLDMLRKIVKVFSFDVEAINKSKEWPHLWSK